MTDTVDKADAWDAVAKAHDVYAAAREEYRKKIAEQAAEIERLRAALQTISDITDYGTETATWRMTSAIHNVNVIARAALAEKEGE